MFKKKSQHGIWSFEVLRRFLFSKQSYLFYEALAKSGNGYDISLTELESLIG
jgi:hypothetical protein